MTKHHISIPVENIELLHAYQKSILSIVSYAKEKKGSEALREDIKMVYRLYNHLFMSEEAVKMKTQSVLD